MAGEHLSSVRKKFVLGVDGKTWELRRFESVVGACLSAMDDVEVNDVGVRVHLPVLASMSANANKSHTRDDLLNSIFQDRLETFDNDSAWIGEPFSQRTGQESSLNLHVFGKFLKFSL